eukprot:jgi/Phyca11/115385/e_gw1.28.124.1
MGRSQLSAVLFTFLLNQLPFSYAGDAVTYDWRLTPIKSAFDGVLLETLGVNDKPCDEAVIEVELGQEVEVRVTNELYDATCLHWHGMKQLGTQEMDGVSGFTQCFIEPNTTAVYRFKPDKAGTFWWHSHHKTQYAFGLRGPLIVHAPESELRDCEKEIEQEYIVQLADIYHAMPPPGPALWDTIAINNRGRFDCNAAAMNNLTDCSPIQPLSTFLFEEGKKYLLRLINLAAMAPFEFSIDDHGFQVIAADGEPVVPTELLNSIFINAGQRYDILIEAKNDTQGLDSFWMRAKGLTGLPWMVRASDTGAPDAEVGAFWMRVKGLTGYPWTARTVDTGTVGFNDEGLAIVRYDSGSLDPTTYKAHETVTIGEFDFTPAKLEVLPANPDDRTTMRFNINTTIGTGIVSLDGKAFQTLVVPDEPPLLSVANGLATAELPASANARGIKYGDHVEVVLMNDVLEQHPFHMHSHVAWVVGSGHASAEDVYNNNLPPLKLNGPMARDVYTVPACDIDDTGACVNVGYVVLRFKADNPGVWMMHCHVDWHKAIGMGMIFVEGEAGLREKGPNAFSSTLLSVCKHGSKGNDDVDGSKHTSSSGDHETYTTGLESGTHSHDEPSSNKCVV